MGINTKPDIPEWETIEIRAKINRRVVAEIDEMRKKVRDEYQKKMEKDDSK